MSTCKSLLGVLRNWAWEDKLLFGWPWIQDRCTGCWTWNLFSECGKSTQVLLGEKYFCGKLDLAPGIALSCLLATLVGEVLCFVLLLPFVTLRHHLPIWTRAEGLSLPALGPTTLAICCPGAAFSLMLPLPLWNGASGLHGFVWFYCAKQWVLISVLAASTQTLHQGLRGRYFGSVWNVRNQ